MTPDAVLPHNTKAAATWNSGGQRYDRRRATAGQHRGRTLIILEHEMEDDARVVWIAFVAVTPKVAAAHVQLDVPVE